MDRINILESSFGDFKIKNAKYILSKIYMDVVGITVFAVHFLPVIQHFSSYLYIKGDGYTYTYSRIIQYVL